MAEQRAWDLVSAAMGSPPSLVRSIGGKCAYRLERYFSAKGSYQAPPLPQAVVIMQFGGKKVSQVFEPGFELDQLVSFPSITGVVPAGQKTRWSASGSLDVVFFYFQGQALKTLENTLATVPAASPHPLAFADAVSSAIGRQLVATLTEERFQSSDYIKTLSTALLGQLCKRIAEDKPGISLRSNTVHLYRIQEVVNTIQSDLKADLSNARLARLIGLHQSHFRGLFRQVTGTTPHQYVLQARLEMAGRLLAHTDLSLSAIAEECGFSSQSHMSSCFRRSYNVTPREYRNPRPGGS